MKVIDTVLRICHYCRTDNAGSLLGDGHDSVTPSAKRHDREHPPSDLEGIVTVLIVSVLHYSVAIMSCTGHLLSEVILDI